MHRERRNNRPWKAQSKPETGLLSYTPDQLAELEGKLAGHVQQPGFPGYNDDRMVFMHSYQHYPQLIIYCEIETDVVAAVDFARERRLHATARSGGHSTAGYSVNDQVVIDTSGLSYVVIDEDAETARVGAGTNFRTLNLMLNAVHRHVPGGGCESVCVAGYMQGGGYGFSSRLFGMNCDLVRCIRMVKANGKVVRASAEENPDLFWAVRGGTGNQFGVLTEIEYNLVKFHEAFGFGIKFPLETEADKANASRVIATLQKDYSNGDTSPENMGHQALLINLPTAKHPDGQFPFLLIRGLYDGTEAECEAAIGPILAHVKDRSTQVDIWERGSYLHLNEILLMTVDPPGLDLPTVSMNTKPMVDGRIIARHHPADQWRDMIDHFLSAPDKTCFIAMEFYGAAINDKAPTEMAYVHRRASMDIFSWAFWTFQNTKEASVTWLDTFGSIAGDMSNGHRYQNYPRRGNDNFKHDYFGENLEELVRIKRAYDPENLFYYEQSLTEQTPLNGGATS